MSTPIVPLALRLQKIPLIGRPLALLVRLLAAGRVENRIIKIENRVEKLCISLQILRDNQTIPPHFEKLVSNLENSSNDIWTVHRQLVKDLQAFQEFTYISIGKSEEDLRKNIYVIRDEAHHTTTQQLKSFYGTLKHDMSLLRNEWRATLARDSRALERSADALSRKDRKSVV